MSTKIETLRWQDGCLEMIDQRHLPKHFTYLSYHSAAEVAEGIRSMVVRGAPAIGCAAAYGIALEALRLQDQDKTTFQTQMQQAFQCLAESRPTAVNLFWALKRMRAIFEQDQQPKPAAQQLLHEAHHITAEDVCLNRQMGAYGAELLKDGARVLTHCNAGALATAAYGTALGVIRAAIASGKRISVIADETRPFLQGARLTAWEMRQENIPVTLITDNMSGHLMATGKIDAVIVGCDRVAANADVANKIGTYMVAVLAKRHQIPFYVACPLSTIDRSIEHGDAIPIEERAADEVLGFREQQWAAEGVHVRNPSFDVTPAELITGLITEKGVLLKPNKASIASLFTDKATL